MVSTQSKCLTMVWTATSERFSCLSLPRSATLFLQQASELPARAFAFAPPSFCKAFPQTPPHGAGLSLQSWNQGPRKEEAPLLSLTLKAQIFPVISEEGTVKLGAGQLLIDGLEDSAVCWVSAIQATCPKTHPCFCWIALQGKTNASQDRPRLYSRHPVLPDFYLSVPAPHVNMENERPLGGA